MSRLLLAALAAGMALAPAVAAATCSPRPAYQHCKSRFPHSQILDLTQPGAGGPITCKGVPTSTVQFDNYYFASSGFVYLCTADVPCSQLVGTLPHQRFC